MITKAAVKFQDKIYTGWRHSFIVHEMVSKQLALIDNLKQDDLGFIDESGTFLSRQEAGLIAFKENQTDRLCEFLFSEDLWDMNGVPRQLGVPYDPMS